MRRLVNAINIVRFLKLLSDFPVSLLIFNTFMVALVPFKSHCYFVKIYLAADTATAKPEADLLDLISQNRDIVYFNALCEYVSMYVCLYSNTHIRLMS